MDRYPCKGPWTLANQDHGCGARKSVQMYLLLWSDVYFSFQMFGASCKVCKELHVHSKQFQQKINSFRLEPRLREDLEFTYDWIKAEKLMKVHFRFHCRGNDKEKPLVMCWHNFTTEDWWHDCQIKLMKPVMIFRFTFISCINPSIIFHLRPHFIFNHWQAGLPWHTRTKKRTNATPENPVHSNS